MANDFWMDELYLLLCSPAEDKVCMLPSAAG